jgi:hypothetical protein
VSRPFPRFALNSALTLALFACTGSGAPATPAAAPKSATTAAPLSAAPASAAASVAATASAPANQPSPAALATLLPHYLAIQEALAGDTLTGVPEAAKQLADAARAAGLNDVADACGALSTGDLKAVRAAFKPISNSMADWALADPATKAQYVVVHCPMAPGSWVQRHRAVRNPYYGKEMLECGDPKN